MARSFALTHVAMSVPVGTLTDAYCDSVLGFYGDLLGWTEMAHMRRPDRLTIWVGAPTYVNLRERPVASSDDYAHFGVIVASAGEVDEVWNAVHALDLVDEPVSEITGGGRSVRFRHLLPAAVEVQWFPAATIDAMRS